MWILNKEWNTLVNSDRTQSFSAFGVELLADDITIGVFTTHDDAKKELKQIYDALIAGQESYSVG